MRNFIEYNYDHDDVNIAYKTNFSKKEFVNAQNVLVFNYGLLCSNEHWRKQIEFFHSLGFKIVLHDYRAHHKSSHDVSLESCTFDNMAADTLGVLSHLQIQSCILLGHSMGVNICLEMMRKKPLLFSKMVLISGILLPPQNTIFNSNILDLFLPYFSHTMKIFPKTFSFCWKYSYTNPLVRKLVHILGFNPRKVHDSFIKDYIKKAGELNPKLLFQLFAEMRRFDTISKLEGINTPTLIITGDKDRVVSGFQQRVFHKYLKSSQLQIVRDAGHVPQWDFPHYVNEKILDFFHCNETWQRAPSPLNY